MAASREKSSADGIWRTLSIGSDNITGGRLLYSAGKGGFLTGLSDRFGMTSLGVGDFKSGSRLGLPDKSFGETLAARNVKRPLPCVRSGLFTFRWGYSVDSISKPQASRRGSGMYLEFLLRRAHSRRRVDRRYWSGESLYSRTTCSNSVMVGTMGPIGSGLPQLGFPRLLAMKNAFLRSGESTATNT